MYSYRFRASQGEFVHSCPQVIEDLLNHYRVFDADDDPDRTTALLAGLDQQVF
jgi:hypothetical protein